MSDADNYINDLPQEQHSLEARMVRARERQKAIERNCWYLGIVGLNDIPTPYVFVSWIVLQNVEEAPTSTELHQAMEKWQNASFVGHYSGNVRHEITIDRAVYPHDSEAFWIGRYAHYALCIRTLRTMSAPVLSNHPWATIAAFKDRTVIAEVTEPHGRGWIYEPQRDVTLADLEWVTQFYDSFVNLWFSGKGEFRTAVESFIDHSWQTSSRVATAVLWAGIEALIGAPENTTQALVRDIPVYLEPPGVQRIALRRHVKRGYKTRCKAAHGNNPSDPMEFMRQVDFARQLLSRLLCKIIEGGTIPSRKDLNALTSLE